jgi:hypothetical protein
VPKITVIAKDNLGYNHLYGEIRKGEAYEIDEAHFDSRYYQKSGADEFDYPVPETPNEIRMVMEPCDVTDHEDLDSCNHE